MPILETDIKLLKSARLTDAPNGGGAMTGNVIVSGADNNLFDDVSNLDRVFGNVSLRKFFPGVLTNTTDKYLGARVIIDAPPADTYIDGTLFAASSLFDVRDQAKARVEAYLAIGTPNAALLYGNHITGMMALALLQREDAALPGIGDVLALQKWGGQASEVTQYVRVATVASQVQTFTDASGDFRRAVVSVGLTDALRYDFPGFEATRVDSGLDFAPKTRVYDTVVANAAQYYGIKPLELAASVGAFTVKATSALSQLLPSAQVESPISDARTNGAQTAFVPVAGGSVTVSVLGPTTTFNLFVGTAVTPGTLTLTQGAVTATDEGGRLKAGGNEIGTVDYANGVLVASVNTFANSAATLTYTPAVTPTGTLQSFGTYVTTANRSLTFASTLASIPTKGSVSFSYMSGGKWYVLADKGDGALRGADTALGAGTVNFVTGTLVVSMGALPDVGSALVVQWVSGSTVGVGGNMPLKANGCMHAPIAVGKALSPSTVVLTWTDGASGSLTAQDNGVGVLTGAATGTVDYQSGNILFSPTVMPAKGVVVSVATQSATKVSNNFAVTTPGGNTAFTLPGPVRARSVSFTGELAFNPTLTPQTDWATTATTGLTWRRNAWRGFKADFRDDGSGNIVMTAWDDSQTAFTRTVGTINYTTGAVLLTLTNSMFVGANGVALEIHTMNPATWQFGGYHMAMGGSAASVGQSLALTGNVVNNVTVSYATGTAAAGSASVVLNEFVTAVDFVPPGSLLGPVSFKLGADRFVSTPAGSLQRNPSSSTGLGTVVGAVTGATGVVSMSTWTPGTTTAVTDFRSQFLAPASGTDAQFEGSRMLFRTPLAPLRPGSLQITGTMQDGATFSVTADASGKINGSRVKGIVNYQFGLVELQFCNPLVTSLGVADLTSWAIGGVTTANVDLARQDTLRYNAVGYTYVSLDANILGLDPVRLPTDGRVPVFKAGRVVVVHNTQKLAPQTVVNAQTVNCGRTLLGRMRVFGANGLEITSGFAKNLDAGTITFTNVAGYSQPVTIEHRIEDEALCADAQITGELRLTRPLTHSYTAGNSYVSSAYIAGTLQAAVADSFSQLAWTDVWADSRIGAPLLAQYNDTATPLVVTNAGAITERWAILFTSNTAFNVVGEEVGQIITGNTATVLSPVNPATGVPYFTLQPAGWGSGWAAGNVLRFNTSGANFPLWAARTVRQSPSSAPGTDQMTITVRGDIAQ